MSVTAVRELTRRRNPFVLGKYPDRLAPAHILNGFVSASLGVSTRATQIREFISAGTKAEKVPFLGRGEWKQDNEKQEALRTDLALIFDADGRAWQATGSLSVVIPELAAGGPNDDGLGRHIWDMVEQNGRSDFKTRLIDLLAGQSQSDPITATAILLAEGSEAPKVSTQSALRDSWYGDRGNSAGKFLAKCLADFLYNLVRPWGDARRLQQLQHLSRGLQVVSVLAQIFGPISHQRSGGIQSVANLAPLLAWGGTPPGDSYDPFVQDCQKSYLRALAQVKQCLAESLTQEFAGVRVDDDIPRDFRRSEAIVAVLQKAGMKREAAEKACKKMQDEDVPTKGGAIPEKKWCSALVNAAYAQTQLPFGLRIMGRKVGLVGPERGAGRPRLMCDTPLLGTLVIGLLGERPTEFREFVDLCRTQLGLIFGIGTEEKIVKEVGLWSQPSRGRNSLLQNQEAFRRRLIRAGLAREYSDGHTEVMAYG